MSSRQLKPTVIKACSLCLTRKANMLSEHFSIKLKKNGSSRKPHPTSIILCGLSPLSLHETSHLTMSHISWCLITMKEPQQLTALRGCPNSNTENIAVPCSFRTHCVTVEWYGWLLPDLPKLHSPSKCVSPAPHSPVLLQDLVHSACWQLSCCWEYLESSGHTSGKQSGCPC